MEKERSNRDRERRVQWHDLERLAKKSKVEKYRFVAYDPQRLQAKLSIRIAITVQLDIIRRPNMTKLRKKMTKLRKISKKKTKRLEI